MTWSFAPADESCEEWTDDDAAEANVDIVVVVVDTDEAMTMNLSYCWSKALSKFIEGWRGAFVLAYVKDV